MKWGDLTRLIRRILRQHAELWDDPTRLVFAVYKITAPSGYHPNAASVVRILYRLKRERRYRR